MQNSFLVNKGCQSSKRYNDISIIQNYTLCKAFNTFMQPDCNIFVNFVTKADLTEKQYWTIRESIICAVLSIDIENHFNVIGKQVTQMTCKRGWL